MKLKKISSIILSIAMIISLLSLDVFAKKITATAGNGTAMTVREFNQTYVGENNRNGGDMSNAISENDVLTIEYGDIIYTPETRNIQFGGIITRNGLVSEIELGGTLYNSYKKDSGINSIVGKLTDNTGRFDVLRFEIYNDTDTSMLYALNTKANHNKPVLLLYLLDGEELYIFETEIPEAMAQITVADTEENKTTEGVVDGFWFQDIVTPQIGVAEEINSRSTEDDKSALLSATWTIAGVPYIYYAKVIMYYHFSDVEDNSGDWRLELNVDDAYCRVNGERNELTGLRITNIDMRMVTGPYTKMLNVVPGFQLIDSSSIIGNVTTVKGLLSVCSAISGNVAASAATTAIDWLIDATQENNSLTENTVFYLPNSRDSSEGRTFGYHVPSRYFMQNIGDYIGFDLRTRASSFGLSSAYGGTKTGVCEIEFDYYVGETTRHYSGFKGVEGTYKCTLA